MDKAVKLLAISIFHKKYFCNLYVITKITKNLYYENLEPYSNYLRMSIPLYNNAFCLYNNERYICYSYGAISYCIKHSLGRIFISVKSTSLRT